MLAKGTVVAHWFVKTGSLMALSLGETVVAIPTIQESMRVSFMQRIGSRAKCRRAQVMDRHFLRLLLRQLFHHLCQLLLRLLLQEHLAETLLMIALSTSIIAIHFQTIFAEIARSRVDFAECSSHGKLGQMGGSCKVPEFSMRRFFHTQSSHMTTVHALGYRRLVPELCFFVLDEQFHRPRVVATQH